MKAFHFYDKVRFILENKISHWATEHAEDMCSKRIKQKKIHDRSILKELINILDNDGDYDMALETVKELLNESSQPFTSGYNHTEYLMKCLRTLIMNAHDSNDESIEALNFYEKVQFILESVISHWANTNHIQIVFLERIGHIRQINNRYKLAVESFERSVKIQRKHEKTLIDVPDTLRCIGLLYMTLGNYKSALASFNETLKLLRSNSSQKDREIRLLYKRIDQATEGLKLVMDSPE
jgi:tetratricopeptide (TPR) repeat protein